VEIREMEHAVPILRGIRELWLFGWPVLATQRKLARFPLLSIAFSRGAVIFLQICPELAAFPARPGGD
jgi:hypothetical protein